MDVRNLFPDMLYHHLTSRNLQKTQTQNGNLSSTIKTFYIDDYYLNHFCRDSKITNIEANTFIEAQYFGSQQKLT